MFDLQLFADCFVQTLIIGNFRYQTSDVFIKD